MSNVDMSFYDIKCKLSRAFKINTYIIVKKGGDYL